MTSVSRFARKLPVLDKVVPPVDDVVRGLTWLACSGIGRFPPSRIVGILDALRSVSPGLGILFSVHAASRPDEIAVVDSRGSITFDELNTRVNRLANSLDADGCTGGGRVAFMLPNCREALEVFGAAAKLGMAPVPINTRFHAEEVAHLLSTQEAQAIVVDPEYRDRVEGFEGIVIVRGDDYEGRLALADPDDPPRASKSAKAVIHTSGTTGHPKGAERDMTRGGAISAVSFFARVPVASADVVVIPAPLFHALGLGGTLFAFIFGAQIVFQERFDPVEFCELIEANEATAGVVVPVMLRRIVDCDRSGVNPGALTALRWMLVSGSALQPSLEQQSRGVFGPVVRNLYGSTEAGWVAIATPEDSELHPGTVGRPVTGVTVEILADDGTVLPPGEAGEISVRSKTVFSGYTEDTESDTEGRDALRYDLGDLGYLTDDGYLFVLDRKDDMVVTGGENVYPAEVERVLCADPDVEEASVLGIADDQYGKILVAFVVAGPSDLTAEDVDARLRAHIANYKVPKHIWLVDALPYNATGKVLRRTLAEDARERLAGT